MVDVSNFLFEFDKNKWPAEDTRIVELSTGLNYDGLFDELTNKVPLAGYGSNNWNSLLDLFRELECVNEKHVVLIHCDLPALFGGVEFNDMHLAAYLDVLNTAIEFWREHIEHKFHVVFPPESRARMERLPHWE